MSAPPEIRIPSRLSLQCRLEDLILVLPWISALGEEHGIPEQTQFAINLCLEEALSNIIRHGHDEDSSHCITVDFESEGKDKIAFAVEDHAEPFDPVQAAEATGDAPTMTEDDLQPGGQGLRFLRTFSSELAYERLHDTNRLTIGFSIPE